MTRFTKIASAAAIAAAIAIPGSQAFAATKTENALIGGALGALAGALIGNGSTGAVVGGAAAGALIGVATDKPDRRYAGQRYSSQTAYRSSYRAQPVYNSYRQPTYRTGYDRDYGYGQGYSQGYYPVNNSRYGY